MRIMHLFNQRGSASRGRGRESMRHGGHRRPHGGGDPMGNEAFARGRKFSSEDLQLLFLSLLAEQPRHGYELIKALEARSNGFYSPSPGVVYPALTYLEDLGYVVVEAHGNRKSYSLSDTGSAYLASHKEDAQMILARLDHLAKKMELVKRAFSGQPFEEGGDLPWVPELIKARHALKKALMLRSEQTSSEEQRRIAAILEQATAQIEQNPACSTDKQG